MKNLKRVLALSLALVMLMGMMAIGTSAADFTDNDEIANTEAVDTMVALNIINGLPDGSFNPEGIVTRAEMAKMICVALNGGRDPQLAANAYSFTDTVGHWAAGYIEYCFNLGIIAGRGDGIFDPTGTVTGSEAAKMLLVAIGYDAEAEGFVGPAWEMAVGVRANQKDLYEDLPTLLPSAGLSRDNAAQMVYNAIQAVKVEYDYKLTTVGGVLTTVAVVQDVAAGARDTIMKDKFDMQTSYGFMNGVVTYSSNNKEYTYGLGTVTNDGATLGASAKSKIDYSDLYGQYVKVLWKNNSSKTVYGIYAKDSKVMASGYTGNLANGDSVKNTLKVGGVEYKLGAATIPVVEAISSTPAGTVANNTATTAASALAPYSLKLIDNDDDGKADVMVVTPFDVVKVTYVGADTITAGGSYNKDDIVFYDGIAKDDYALITAAVNTASGKATFTKADVSTGTIIGTKDSGSKFLIDGVWYSKASGVTAGALNDTVDYIGFGGVLYYAKVQESGATSKDISMIINAAAVAAGIDAGKVEAKLLLADGTKKVVTVSKINGATATFTGGTPATATTDVATYIGALVTYKVDSDGKYELTTVSGSNLAGYKGVGSTAVYTNKTVGGKELADDAIVFVLNGTKATDAPGNDGKIYTGKELKNAYGAGGFGTATTGTTLYNTVSGFDYAKVSGIVFTAFPTITSASNFGYLTADAYESVESGSTYRNFTIWNGTETITVKEKASGLTGLKAGVVVTYDTVSDTVIKNVSIAAVVTGAVTGWDSDSKISINNLGISKVDSDTVVLYVNSKDKKGVAGGAISIADEPTSGNYVNNVRYIGNTTVLELIVVDVNNEMKAVGLTLPTGASQADVEAALVASDSVTVSGAFTTTGAFAVPAGKTLTVTGTFVTGANTTAVAGSLVLNGTATLNTGAVTVAAAGKVTLGTASTVDDASLITGAAAGAKITFKVGATVTASVTEYYAAAAASPSAAAVTSPVVTADAVYVWADVDTDGPVTMGWLLD